MAAERRVIPLGRHRAGTALVVDGHEGEGRGRDLVALPRAEAPGPGLDRDAHRGPTDALDPRVDAEHVADLDGADERHAVDRHRDDAAPRPVHAGDAARDVHLRHDPAAEDVAVGVGVGRHGDGPHRQVALRQIDLPARRRAHRRRQFDVLHAVHPPVPAVREGGRRA